ncbi:MAG: zinc ribbon domain-containing protein [Anaerolineales bacterium]
MSQATVWLGYGLQDFNMSEANHRFRKIERIFLRVFLFIALCLVPLSTMAQVAPRVKSLEIALWPEYDRSEMLVIMRMQLADDVPLPTTVELPIPTRVGEPSAVAKWDPVSGPNDQVQWDRIEGDEWSTITVQIDVPGVWIEYYDALTLDGSERSYSFQWPGGFDIESLRFRVQQPKVAESMSVSGATDVVEEDGILYHIIDVGALNSDEGFRVDVSYSNPSGQLTNPALIVRPEETSGGTPDISTWLPYVIGGFGVLMLVLGAILWVRLRQGVESGTPRRRNRRKSKGESRSASAEGERRFCHYCGTPANAEDNYCRSCGTKLRRG